MMVSLGTAFEDRTCWVKAVLVRTFWYPLKVISNIASAAARKRQPALDGFTQQRHLLRAFEIALIIASSTTFGLADAYAVTTLRTAAQIASDPKFVATSVGGICVDIMRAIEHVDPSLRFEGIQEWRPLPRIEAQLDKGDLDIVCGLLRNRAREEKYTYIEPSLFAVNYFLVARADDGIEINSWDDVRALGNQGSLLAIHGFGIVSKLAELGLKVDDGATTSEANIGKLLVNRGRFYIHRSPGIETEIRRAGRAGKVRLLPTAMLAEQFYMVARRSMSADIVEKLSKAVRYLDQTGELVRLFDKWKY